MTSSPELRFPKSARVRTRADYVCAFDSARRVHGAHFQLVFKTSAPEAADTAKLGLAVSKKVDTRAVNRNRIRRVLKEAFRAISAQAQPGTYVFVAKPSARAVENAGLSHDFLRLMQRAGALPPSPPQGTMQRPPTNDDSA